MHLNAAEHALYDWLERMAVGDPKAQRDLPIAAVAEVFGTPWFKLLLKQWQQHFDHPSLATMLWMSLKHLQRHLFLLQTLPADAPSPLIRRWQRVLSEWQSHRMQALEQAQWRFQSDCLTPQWLLADPQKKLLHWVTCVDQAWGQKQNQAPTRALMQQWLSLGIQSCPYVPSHLAREGVKPLTWHSQGVCILEAPLFTLLHFRAQGASRRQRTPLLVVYALLSEPNILDIHPKHSLIQSANEAGIDVYLLHWHDPKNADPSFKQYALDAIDDAVDHVTKKCEVDAVQLLGVCQGGVFALIYAALRPRRVNRLVTLVTPVDHALVDGGVLRLMRGVEEETVTALETTVPGPWVGAFLDELSPFQSGKALLSGALQKAPQRRSLFRAMETWRLRTRNLTPRCLREYWLWVVKGNGLVNSAWLEGEQVALGNVQARVLNVCASHDRLVPLSSALALEQHLAVSQCETMRVDSGHIGAFVGRNEGERVREAVINWLTQTSVE